MTAPTPLTNPPRVPPRWWDGRFEWPSYEPLPGMMLPCGCHIRRPDYEAVLCGEHLAELNR